KADHEVTHGPAEPHDAPRVAAAHDDHSHGHGPWHGPHESPTAMTYPLMALAVGAIVAGFVGISPAICCTNEIEHFLEPSFTAAAHGEMVPGTMAAGAAAAAAPAEPQAAAAEGEEAGPHVSRTAELGLMFFSVLVAV